MTIYNIQIFTNGRIKIYNIILAFLCALIDLIDTVNLIENEDFMNRNSFPFYIRKYELFIDFFFFCHRIAFEPKMINIQILEVYYSFK